MNFRFSEKEIIDYLKKTEGVDPNYEQRNAISEIKKIIERSLFPKLINKLFQKKSFGIYLHGKVGRGKSIIVSSIQLSASGQVFEEIRDILPWATKIEICPAVCPKTGNDAYYTVRKSRSGTEIEVGGSDLYEPRAWSHTTFMNNDYGENYG